jgi:hypothetical protein
VNCRYALTHGYSFYYAHTGYTEALFARTWRSKKYFKLVALLAVLDDDACELLLYVDTDVCASPLLTVARIHRCFTSIPTNVSLSSAHAINAEQCTHLRLHCSSAQHTRVTALHSTALCVAHVCLFGLESIHEWERRLGVRPSERLVMVAGMDGDSGLYTSPWLSHTVISVHAFPHCIASCAWLRALFSLMAH